MSHQEFRETISAFDFIDTPQAEAPLRDLIGAQNADAFKASVTRHAAFWKEALGEEDLNVNDFLDDLNFDTMVPLVQTALDGVTLRQMELPALEAIILAGDIATLTPLLVAPLVARLLDEAKKTALQKAARIAYLEKKMSALNPQKEAHRDFLLDNGGIVNMPEMCGRLGITAPLLEAFVANANDVNDDHFKAEKALALLTKMPRAAYQRIQNSQAGDINAVLLMGDDAFEDILDSDDVGLSISSHKINQARTALGQVHIAKRLEATQDEDLLERVLVCKTEADLRTLFGTFDPGDHYRSLAINNANVVQAFRGIASRRLLEKRLDRLDPQILERLAKLQKPHDLHLFLYKESALGFNKLPFSELTQYFNDKNANEIIAKAYLQNRLKELKSRDEINDLMPLCHLSNLGQMGVHWNLHFGDDPKTPAGLSLFFQNEANKDWFQKKVILQVWKKRLQDTPLDNLGALSPADVLELPLNHPLFTADLVGAMNLEKEAENLRKKPFDNANEISEILNGNAIFQALTTSEATQLKTTLLGKAVPFLNEATLVIISSAQTLDEIKTLLQPLQIESLDWFDEKAKETLQHTVCNHLLETRMNGRGRPHLLAFLQTLSLPKKQEILASGDVILRALQYATTREEVNYILNHKEPIPSLATQELEHVARAFRIQNPALGAWIRENVPPQNLNDHKVSEINRRISLGDDGLLPDFYLNNDRNAFNQTMGHVLGIGINIPNATYNEICAQGAKSLNASLLAIGQHTPTDIACFRFLMTIPKSEDPDIWTAERFRAIRNHVRDSADYTTFLQDIDAIEGLSDATKAELKNRFTKVIFDEFQIGFSSEKLTSPQRREALLNRNKASLDTIQNSFKQMKTTVSRLRGHLRKLAKCQSLKGIDPAFQEINQSRAEKLLPNYEALASNLENLISDLKNKEETLYNMFCGIPRNLEAIQNEPHGKDVLKQKKALEKLLNEVREELELYENALRVLKGDEKSKNPFLKKGVIETLKSAKTNRQDFQFRSFSDATYRDVPVSEKRKYAPVNWQNNGANVENEENQDKPYYTEDGFLREEKGYYREWTFQARTWAIEENDNPAQKNEKGQKNKAAQGQFTEEIIKEAAKDIATNKKAEDVHSRYTATKWPTIYGDDGAVNQEATHNARVEMAMMMLTRMLAKRTTPPAPPCNRLVIKDNGKDAFAAIYLYEAALCLGQCHSKMQFGKDAILVRSPNFNPKTLFGKMSFIRGHSDVIKIGDEKYHFKKAPAYQSGISDFKKFMDDKYNKKPVESTEKTLTEGQKKVEVELEAIRNQVAGREQREQEERPHVRCVR